MRWMLDTDTDTDTCIAIIKRQPESALRRLRESGRIPALRLEDWLTPAGRG